MPSPPIAERRPKELAAHGRTRIDDYYWLRERENEDVLAYLRSENAYLEEVMADTKKLRDKLYQEIIERIRKDDESPPVFDIGYWWYRRYEAGKEYAIHCRRKSQMTNVEEVVLDVNAVAHGHDFCSVDAVRCADNGRYLTYSVDFKGRREYELRIRDTSIGEDLPDRIAMTGGWGVAWANDHRTLFYTRIDPETLRGYQVWRHGVGTDPAEDTLIFQEDDETFDLGVHKTKSKRYLVISASHTLSDEYRLLDANDPAGEFHLLFPRERKHEYHIHHYGEHFYIVTNRDAVNNRLMRCPVDRTSFESWEEVIPHREDVLLQAVDCFCDHLVLYERVEGLTAIRVQRWDGAMDTYLNFEEDAYTVWGDANPSFDTKRFRFGYTSMTQPISIFETDLDSDKRKLLKRYDPEGEYDPSQYRSERLEAKADDGARIPISLVYRIDRKRDDGSNPLLLYGYGSYGACIDPDLDEPAISLLDRGFICAVANIRGGKEKGRLWYDHGKMLLKRNTFTDYIACAQHLIDRGTTRSDRLVARGASAGGLLMGAVVNLRPDLFACVVAEVPFVDVVTTMLDSSIPLTTSEFDEWGSPDTPEHYDYMLSYSPYDNVTAQRYPPMLVTTGLHDSQVQYWEPAKWVAKLRATRTDKNLLLLKCDMGTGHGGKTGRFKHHEDTAFIYAFILKVLGLNE